MTMTTHSSNSILICIAAVFGVTFCEKDSPAQQVAPAKIRRSKKTTHLTQPVRKDGFVDYAAAINEKLRQGVTPKNNAAALIAKTLGPSVFSKAMRVEFFRRLRIPIPPESGTYFLSMSKFARRGRSQEQASAYASRLIRQQSAGSSRLWSRRELPDLAAWLDANHEPLSRVLEAADRAHWYCPVVVSDEDFDGVLISALMPLQQECRSVVRALSCRALLAVREGRIDDARGDILCCHRLARHVGKGFSLIDLLLGYALESVACQTEVVMLQSGRLTIKQLNAHRNSLRQLESLPSVAQKIDFGERLMVLDSIRYVYKHRVKGLKSLSELTANPAENAFRLLNRNMDLIDWNRVMTMVNEEFDRMRDAVARPTYAQRKQAITQLTARYKRIAVDIRSPRTLAEITKGGKVDRVQLSVLLGRLFIRLFLPGTHAARVAEDRSKTRLSLSRIAIALETYRKTNGRFPRKLSTLVPRFLKRLPEDLYSGRAFPYRATANSYLLFSVGANQKNDGGRTFDSQPPGDDIAVRVNISR